jgi:alpha-glucosidase
LLIARDRRISGPTLRPHPPGDTAWSRRFRDILAEIISDQRALGTAPLSYWRKHPVEVIETCLVNPETGQPFELLPAERAFLQHAFTFGPDGKLDRLVAYYGNDLGEAHLPFNFSLLETRWHARDIAKLVDDYEAALPEGGWPNWVLGYHDRPRIATRVGSPQVGIAAMLLLTLRGTPTIYYGDEIGLPQVPIPPDRIRDPFEKNVPSIGVGRDGARTPMQWDCSPFAGFSSSEPWLPLTADWTMRNVDMLRRDKKSIYMIYHRLIEARRHSQALQRGSCRPIASKGDLLLYVREFGSERILTALNLGTTPAIVESSFGDFKGRVIVSTSGLHDGDHIDAIIRLDANEGVVIALAPDAALPSIAE